MKIIHFSDTHLGYSDLDIVNHENINQREADFYDAFSLVVEQIQIIQPDYYNYREHPIWELYRSTDLLILNRHFQYLSIHLRQYRV